MQIKIKKAPRSGDQGAKPTMKLTIYENIVIYKKYFN